MAESLIQPSQSGAKRQTALHLLKLSASSPSISPSTIGGQIADCIMSKGLPIIARQLVLPNGVIPVGNSIQNGTHTPRSICIPLLSLLPEGTLILLSFSAGLNSYKLSLNNPGILFHTNRLKIYRFLFIRSEGN